MININNNIIGLGRLNTWIVLKLKNNNEYI